MLGALTKAMIAYDEKDVARIHHFLKVWGFAKAIGELEGLDPDTQAILEAAALTHDIGIRNSERKFGNCTAEHQQTEGPPEARRMLEALGFEEALIERVCALIACHHVYMDITDIDHQILVEADYLVNAFEHRQSPAAVRSFMAKVFKTKTGTGFLKSMYEMD